MPTSHISRARHAALVVLALLTSLASPASATQQTTQTFELQPGWNSIFLEVQPANNATADVFGALPVDSVWTWHPDPSPVEYISDPSEPTLRDTGWLGYFPPARPEAILTNLFRIHANRPYLIRLGGTDPVTWTVTGRPAFRMPRWVPDSFNLVGGYVDPAGPPTFGEYFASSPAHDGQPIYRLDSAGVWQLASAQDTMAAGEAFWIYTAGSSDFGDPLGVRPAVGDGVDFGEVMGEVTVQVTHRGDSPTTLQARLLTPGPISYQTFDAAEQKYSWEDLAAGATLDAAAEETLPLRLAVRRAELSGTLFESVLEISDGAGCRRLLPVRALQPTSSGSPWAGLWVGTATLDEVSSLPAATPGDTGPPPLAQAVSSRFDLRLLVHVDDAGQARLLKEVIQMWETGTGGNPGRYVLVTDDSLILNYGGSALADGEPVGRRVSTAAFDFDPASGDWDAATRTLRFGGGSFGTGGSTLATTIVLPRTHPSNPFYHRYHPIHGDDCGCFGNTACLARCNAELQLTRIVELTFDADDPTRDPGDGANPDWGVRRVAGSYSETIEGLHRLPLTVAGTFTLQRVADQGELNP